MHVHKLEVYELSMYASQESNELSLQLLERALYFHKGDDLDLEAFSSLNWAGNIDSRCTSEFRSFILASHA